MRYSDINYKIIIYCIRKEALTTVNMITQKYIISFYYLNLFNWSVCLYGKLNLLMISFSVAVNNTLNELNTLVVTKPPIFLWSRHACKSKSLRPSLFVDFEK